MTEYERLQGEQWLLMETIMANMLARPGTIGHRRLTEAHQRHEAISRQLEALNEAA